MRFGALRQAVLAHFRIGPVASAANRVGIAVRINDNAAGIEDPGGDVRH